MNRRKLLILFLILSLNIFLSGCASLGRVRKPASEEDISRLRSELDELERAKAQLEDRLKDEIAQNQVKVEMLERGLVITFVAEVLFDSGKDKLRSEALDTLNKISSILKTTVKDLAIGIEGHTDNVPIKYSGWRSNWELSAARALSVLHYLIDSQGIEPQRLSATGFGEYHPLDTNDTAQGRRKNRRVEIAILPKVSKTRITPQEEEKIIIRKNLEAPRSSSSDSSISAEGPK